MKKLTLTMLFFMGALWANQLSSITSWAYQLQDANIDEITSNTTFDLIVMDYSLDGSDAEKYTPAEINKIKASGKLPIAYISIGEVENYRYYWKSEWNSTKPDWLGPENPDWAGNFEAKYWYPQWQDIIIDYVDTIISQGFSGIYLDIVEGFYYWQEKAPLDQRESGADTSMIKFIERLRQEVDSKSSGEFSIIPQNGASILDAPNVESSDSWKNRYFAAINAIGVEDVFFYGDKDINNSYNPETYRLNLLSQYTAKDIPVFSIDYLTTSSLIEKYKTEAAKNGFIPYCSVRNLDILTNGFKDVSPISEFSNNSLSQNNLKITQLQNSLQLQSAEKITKITLFTATGRKLRSTNLSKLNLQGVAKGIYLVEITFKNGFLQSFQLAR